MQENRTRNTAKNIFWGFAGNILTMILQFISRTVFIYSIGVTFLGINGLFTSVLGMLSLTELGIGTAMNYSLYKPVSSNDIEKIKSLMAVYKKAYRIIAIVVFVLGLAILPFLNIIIKEASDIQYLRLYYLFFLFNTVSSYLVSYKYGLVNTEQKGYIITNFNSICSIVTSIVQIVVLVLFKNYIVYLLGQACCQLLQKIGINSYINRKYPYLRDSNFEKLDAEESQKIKTNVKGLLIHKIGEVSIHQTDNIIVSSFVDIATVGLLSNYNLIINSITGFITIVVNSTTASLGNLIATEGKERQENIFDIYNFVGFWLYGFTGVCFFVLFTPFISMWIGADKLIDNFSLALIVLNHYLQGQRLTLSNMKVAGGIFKQDRFISLFQGLINLIVSIVMVKLIGLPGVFVGTVVSGLYSNIARPRIVYKSMFGTSSRTYFFKSGKYLLVFIATVVLLYLCNQIITLNNNLISFILRAFLCTILSNAIFLIAFGKTREFKEIKQRVISLLLKRRKN